MRFRRPVAVAEQRHKTFTVERVAGGRRRGGDFQQRRIEIDVNRRHVTRRAGFHLSGPANEERIARAALVETAFAAAERRVVGDVADLETFAPITADAAVVAGKYQHRVIGQLEFIEHGHDTANAFIHAGDHGGIGRIAVSARGRLTIELVDQFLLGLERSMHGEVRQIEEKRPVLVPADEVHRFVGQPVGEISVFGMIDGRLRLEMEMLLHGGDGLVEAALARMMGGSPPRCHLPNRPVA